MEIIPSSPQYHARVNKSPVTSKIEYGLGCRWRDHHDLSAAHQLIGNSLHLAGRIAEGYGSYGVPPQELIAEAYVGLMRAVCRFDPDQGVPFATCATWHVREAIHQYMLHTNAMPLLQMTLFCTMAADQRHSRLTDPIPNL